MAQRAEVRGEKCEVRAETKRLAPLPSNLSPSILIPSAKTRKSWVDLRDWIWCELKDGGWLTSYLKREKHQSKDRCRAIGRIMHGFTQNNKSDFQRKADIPAREFHRWKAEDEHFFDDDNNLRSLKRDNPELPIYVGPRAMPSTVQRKTYPAMKCEVGSAKGETQSET